MNLDEVIRESLVEHYRTTTAVDKYGQMPISNLTINSFIKDKDLAKQVYEFINEGNSKIVSLSTYGSRCFTYEAIMVLDNSLSVQLNAAFAENKTREKMLNNWF